MPSSLGSLLSFSIVLSVLAFLGWAIRITG